MCYNGKEWYQTSDMITHDQLLYHLISFVFTQLKSVFTIYQHCAIYKYGKLCAQMCVQN